MLCCYNNIFYVRCLKNYKYRFKNKELKCCLNPNQTPLGTKSDWVRHIKATGKIAQPIDGRGLITCSELG
jgi:hypothetical protein